MCLYCTSDPFDYFVPESAGLEKANKYSFQGDTAKLEKAVSTIEIAVHQMQELGATVISPADIPSMQELADTGFQAQATIQNTEFKEDITKYLDTMASTEVRNLQDIIESVPFLPAYPFSY
jgi:glutamine synthetase type III